MNSDQHEDKARKLAARCDENWAALVHAQLAVAAAIREATADVIATIREKA